MHWLGVLGIVGASLLALLHAAVAPLPPMSDTNEAIGYKVGTLLGAIGLPALVAYLVAGRRKARNPNRFAIVFVAVALVMTGLNVAGSAATGGSGFETTDQKIGRLMREAAGLQPVHKPFFGEDQVDIILRDVFKDLLAFNKEYQAAADKLDISQVTELNTAQSLANPTSAAKGLKQLHAAYELDAMQEQRLQQMIEEFRGRFGGLSPSARDELITGFNEGLAKSMPARQRAVAAEQAWIRAVDSVYDYARYRHSYFSAIDDQLVISNNAVLQEFNSRVDNMNRHHDDFLQAKKDIDELQQKFFQRAGLTREQTGLR